MSQRHRRCTAEMFCPLCDGACDDDSSNKTCYIMPLLPHIAAIPNMKIDSTGQGVCNAKMGVRQAIRADFSPTIIAYFGLLSIHVELSDRNYANSSLVTRHQNHIWNSWLKTRAITI